MKRYRKSTAPVPCGNALDVWRGEMVAAPSSSSSDSECDLSELQRAMDDIGPYRFEPYQSGSSETESDSNAKTRDTRDDRDGVSRVKYGTVTGDIILLYMYIITDMK